MPIKKNANIKRREKKAKNRSYTQNGPSEEKEEEEEEEKEEKPELPKEDDKEKPATDDALDTDLDPLADLDNDAPPEFICPITMSVMKDPVIMPDGQTYEREAIQRALSVNPISPVTREPMDMSQATTNYALKNLIDKYIQSHIQEIEKEPTIIDPTTMFQQDQQPSPEIPIIELDKIPIKTFSAQYTTDSMLITVKPQQINGRLPVSIIAIIDISSSMIIDATIHDNSSEDTSISRIQLVQYSLKTIISTLGESDQLTIITFNGKAHVKASGVLLTREGKERVNKIIDDIDPDGMTNLWDGLDKGINEAIKQQNKRMNTSLLVFTDGQPNVHPPMGLIPTLKEKLEDKKYYLQTYCKVRAIYDHIKEHIKDELHHLRERIIGYAFEDLKNEAGDLLDAIIRVYDSEKDTFITFELIDKFVEDRFQMIIEDVFCAYNTAKRLLTTFSFEAKKERTKNASKYAIYFRKITIYPDGKKVPDEWKLARNEKRSLLNQFLEFINYKDYTYVKKIDQHQYTELLNLFENKK